MVLNQSITEDIKETDSGDWIRAQFIKSGACPFTASTSEKISSDSTNASIEKSPEPNLDNGNFFDNKREEQIVKEKRSSIQYIINMVPFYLKPILGELDKIKSSVQNDLDNFFVHADSISIEIKDVTNLFIRDLHDKIDLEEILSYLSFIRGVFIYEIKIINLEAIRNIVNALTQYSKNIDSKVLNKSKKHLIQKGFVGGTTF